MVLQIHTIPFIQEFVENSAAQLAIFVRWTRNRAVQTSLDFLKTYMYIYKCDRIEASKSSYPKTGESNIYRKKAFPGSSKLEISEEKNTILLATFLSATKSQGSFPKRIFRNTGEKRLTICGSSIVLC